MPPIQLPTESARSVRVEMVYCAAGPDAGSESGKDRRTLAYGSAFIFELDGQMYLVTARHNVTGRHWQTGAWLGEFPMSDPSQDRPPREAAPVGWPIGPSEVGAHVGATQIKAKAFLVPLIGEDWRPIWWAPDVRRRYGRGRAAV